MVNTEIRLIIFFAAKDGETLYCQQKQDWELSCGSDHEFLIVKFRLKLKKVGKTIRPFRYDLNQISCAYTVEMTNRFKGLDLIECLVNYGWRLMTLYRRQWSRPSQEKEMQKGEMVVWGRLTNSWQKRSKRQRGKGKKYLFECRVLKNSKKR